MAKTTRTGPGKPADAPSQPAIEDAAAAPPGASADTGAGKDGPSKVTLSKSAASTSKAAPTTTSAAKPPASVETAKADTLPSGTVPLTGTAEPVPEPDRAAEPVGPAAAGTIGFDPGPAAEPSKADESAANPAATRSTPLPPVPVAPRATVQKVGFVPLVLGGAVAAALGFGAAWLWLGQSDDTGATAALQTTIDAQAGRITELEAAVGAIPGGPDLTPLESRIDESQTTLGGQIDAIGTRLDDGLSALDARLTALERQPESDGTLADAAIASWQTELDGLRSEIAAQQARMDDIASTAEENLAAVQADAQAELEATRAAADRVEQDAQAATQTAVSRAALARIQVAVESGVPFQVALNDLADTGADIPDVLSRTAPDGVPTMAQLRDAYPESARAALATARSEGLADTTASTGVAFLRSQFNVRSVAPRGGDDPDAILSRAEAAVSDNRLTDAVAEVEALPEVARAEMSGWLALAQTRADAMAAVLSLDQTINN